MENEVFGQIPKKGTKQAHIKNKTVKHFISY